MRRERPSEPINDNGGDANGGTNNILNNIGGLAKTGGGANGGLTESNRWKSCRYGPNKARFFRRDRRTDKNENGNGRYDLEE